MWADRLSRNKGDQSAGFNFCFVHVNHEWCTWKPEMGWDDSASRYSGLSLRKIFTSPRNVGILHSQSIGTWDFSYGTFSDRHGDGLHLTPREEQTDRSLPKNSSEMFVSTPKP